MMRHEFHWRGRRVSYLERPLEAGGPARGTVVFIHAFPLSAAMWQPQLAALPAGWRGLAPDLLGFGESDLSQAETPSIHEYADEVAALLDHTRATPAVMVGLSMGGYACFALLRSAPDTVRALVLADTRPDADAPSARAARQQSLEALEREGVPAVAAGMVPRLLGATTQSSRREMVEDVRRLALAQPQRGVADGIRRLMTRPDSTPLLRAISVPTLVVVGEEDVITDVSVARTMYRQIPQAELAIIPKAGHLSNLEQPEAFNLALAQFLSRL